MLSTLANLVAVALAGAMSTVPVSVTIMILLSPNPRRGALPFLVGSIAGSIMVVSLSTAGLRFLPVRPELGQDVLLGWLGLLIGAALIVYAVYLFGRRSQTDGAKLDKIKTKLQSARPWKFLALGLVLNLRPKAILLAVTAGALISVREPPPLQGTLLVLAYAAVAQSAVVVPIAIWLRSPKRAQGTLTAVDAWLQRNGGTIAAILTLAVGVFLVGYGVVKL